MEIVLIAAVARNGVIGRAGSLPWSHPADLRHFRRVTLGHPVLMGRRTYESLPRRPLEGRTNLVLTRQSDYPAAPGVIVCGDLEAARRAAGRIHAERLFVAGGEQVYRLALPVADEVLLTIVPDEVTGDAHFPDWGDGWQCVDRRERHGLSFETYRRRA